jgi:4-amino-4-deoxy-L-arabinose transferase-like glycosyltransferase
MDAPNATAPRWHLPLLLGLTLGLTAYLYARTAAVTEDSVIFLQYARQLHGEIPDVDHMRSWPRGALATAVIAELCRRVPPLQVIVRGEQHPGYPLLILGVQQAVGPWLSAHPVWMWVRSGQVASMLAGLLLTAALYRLGRHLLGPSAALAGSVLLLLTPVFLQIRADVLSDDTALALLVLSGYFACRLVEGGGLRDGIACGTCGGLAYLVRPEAAQLAVVAAALLALRMLRERRRDSVLSFAAVVVPLLLLCAPYMFLRGSVMTKQRRVFEAKAERLRQEWAPPTPIHRKTYLPESVPEPVLKVATGAWRVGQRWAECVGGLTLLALGVGLIVRRRDLTQRPAHRLIAATVVGSLIVLPGVLFYRKGYIDWRHTLPLAALTVFWVWPGLLALGAGLAALVRRGAPRLPASAFAATTLAALGLALALTPGVFRTLRTPLHGERHGYQLAGQWLSGHAGEGNIATPESLPCFYAGRDADRFWDYSHPPLNDATLDRILTESQPAEYLVVSDHYVHEHERPDGLPGQTQAYRLEPVKQFCADRDTRGQTQILIYRITPVNQPL